MNIDVNRIGGIQKSSLRDIGRIDVYAETTNALGDVIKSYVPGSNINCGFVGSGGGKVYRDSFVVDSESATVRIDRSVVVSKQDHFVLLVKSEVTLTSPIVFNIESIQPGTGIWILRVKCIEV